MFECCSAVPFLYAYSICLLNCMESLLFLLSAVHKEHSSHAVSPFFSVQHETVLPSSSIPTGPVTVEIRTLQPEISYSTPI